MKVSKQELRRIIREEKVRLRREGMATNAQTRGASGARADNKKMGASRQRRVIREQVGRTASPGPYPHEDVVLKQAMDIFGTDVLIDEVDGEVVVDVGDDSVVEALYDKWISTWPDGIMEEGGLIYTGVMVQ